MKVSNMLSTLSNRASSFKIAAVERLLSFTSTDSQDTNGRNDADVVNLQPDPLPSPPFSPPSQVNDAIIPEVALQIEAAPTVLDETTEQDFRKIMNGVALGVVSFSLILIVNQLPASAQPHVLLVAAHNASVYLSFFLGGGLLLYSTLQIIRKVSSKTLNKVTVVAVVSLTLAFALRSCAVSRSVNSLILGWVLFLAIAAVLLLYLHFTREH